MVKAGTFHSLMDSFINFTVMLLHKITMVIDVNLDFKTCRLRNITGKYPRFNISYTLKPVFRDLV